MAVNYVSSEAPGQAGRRADQQDGPQGHARAGRRGGLSRHVPHGPGRAPGVRPPRHPHQQCRHQLRQDLRQDGPRLLAQGPRHQSRRRVQLHQGLHRPDDPAELGPRGEHHLGHRPDRQFRPGQLCRVQSGAWPPSPSRSPRSSRPRASPSMRWPRGSSRPRWCPGFPRRCSRSCSVRSRWVASEKPTRSRGPASISARATATTSPGPSCSINGGLFMW